MKLLYTTMYSALLMGAIGFNATAQQQLPNSGFQDGWVACNPWTSNGTKSTGTTPKDWCISNVVGFKLVGTIWMGATTVGNNVEGYESTSAVQVTNSPNSVAKTQTVPGYVTLGTTWSTANTSGAESDGGTFGGYKFSDRPAGLQFMYKRSDNDQNIASSVVAYLWKGEYSQADVPGNINDKPTPVTMINRDRNILGIPTTKGGVVSTKNNATLIAVINTSIAGKAEEWTKYSAKFDYKSDETPEMINVILAAGDYFAAAADVKPNVSLTVDNVRVFYEYKGYLNIKMNPVGAIAENQDATIQIVPTGEDQCTFTLPNFNLISLELNLGDIVVNNVTVSEKDGEKYYEGSVDGLKLHPEGAAEDEYIVANVSLSGTTNNMKISVDWLQDPTDPTVKVPIEVTFTKEPDPTTGITDITADVDNLNAPVEFYNLQGIRVNGDNLTPGIYVRRQGSAVSKILVK